MAQEPSQMDLEQRAEAGDGAAANLLGDHHREGDIDRVLSCRPISGITGVKRPRPEAFWPVDVLLLAERLLWLGRKQQPD